MTHDGIRMNTISWVFNFAIGEGLAKYMKLNP